MLGYVYYKMKELKNENVKDILYIDRLFEYKAYNHGIYYANNEKREYYTKQILNILKCYFEMQKQSRYNSKTIIITNYDIEKLLSFLQDINVGHVNICSSRIKSTILDNPTHPDVHIIFNKEYISYPTIWFCKKRDKVDKSEIMFDCSKRSLDELIKEIISEYDPSLK